MELGLLLIRLVIGVTLAGHGVQKLFGWLGGGGLTGTAGYMEVIGFRPGRMHALAAGGVELLAGLLFALGLFTPVAAAMILGVMIVAAMAGHPGKGFFVTKGGWEYCFVLAGVAIGVAFTGPGPWSLDHLVGFSGGGWYWGFVALGLGVVGAGAQMATRRLEVDLREDEEPAPTSVRGTSGSHVRR
jgi:putative oxidoreductase